MPPQHLILSADDTFEAEFRPDLLGGATVLTGPALKMNASEWQGALYQGSKPTTEPVTVTAIPYHLWANRDAGGMLVWMMER